MTRSDSTKGQHPQKTKAVHESVFLQTYPEDDIHVWLRPPLVSLVLFLRKNIILKTKTGKKITNRSAGGRIQPRAKEWTAISPGVLGTAAALSHYSALPQRSDGGWDGAEPHTGHRGCNKSQMCWGDVKIHGQAPLFKIEHAHMYMHAHTLRRLSYLKNVSTEIFVLFMCFKNNSWH